MSAGVADTAAVSAGAADSAAASAGAADSAAVEALTAPPVPGVQKPPRWVGKWFRDRIEAAPLWTNRGSSYVESIDRPSFKDMSAGSFSYW